MAVTRMSTPRGKRFRKSVKARSAWTRRKDVSSDRSYRSVVPRMRGPDFGFPDKLVTTMRYVETLIFNAATNGVSSNSFSMNSLYDPNQTGVGHQPMYFDQLCGAVGSAPYLRYRVLGSKATCTYSIFSPPSIAAANYGPVMVGLTCNSANGLYGTTSSQLAEASNTTWTILGDKGGGNNVKTLSVTYSPSRDSGVDAGDDSITGQYNTDPSNQFFAIPWKTDMGGGGATVYVTTHMEYRVEFYKRNEVAQS